MGALASCENAASCISRFAELANAQGALAVLTEQDCLAIIAEAFDRENATLAQVMLLIVLAILDLTVLWASLPYPLRNDLGLVCNTCSVFTCEVRQLITSNRLFEGLMASKLAICWLRKREILCGYSVKGIYAAMGKVGTGTRAVSGLAPSQALTWPPATPKTTELMVLLLAQELRVQDALDVVKRIRERGMPCNEEVPFGLVVESPLAPGQPLTVCTLLSYHHVCGILGHFVELSLCGAGAGCRSANNIYKRCSGDT